MKKTIVALCLLAVMAFAGQVRASEAPGHSLTIGGAIQADMGWQILGKDSTFANNSDSTITNFFASINSDSYLRAMFTSADKTTGATVELGVASIVNDDNSGNTSGDNDFYLRYAYGWWNVGSCKLLVGQMDGRLGDGGTMQMVGDMKSGKGGTAGFGFIGATRNPKVALQVEVNDNVGFEVALGQAGAEHTSNLPSSYYDAEISSTNSYLPRLEAVVDFTFDAFTFGVGAGISYQQMKGNDSILGNSDYEDSVLSYLFWVPVEFNHGPFTAVLNAHYGQNVDTDWTGENTTDWDWARSTNGIYGNQPGSLPVVRPTDNGYELEDSKQWGIGLDLNFAVSDQLTLAVGGGFTNVSNDAWGGDGSNGDDYTRWSVYVAAPYAVTDNFTIQPEVGYYNYGDKVGVLDAGENGEAGDEWLLGIHFQFLF